MGHVRSKDPGVHTLMLISLFSDTQVSYSVVEADKSVPGQIYEIPSMRQCLPRSCVGGYQGMHPGPHINAVV